MRRGTKDIEWFHGRNGMEKMEGMMQQATRTSRYNYNRNVID